MSISELFVPNNLVINAGEIFLSGPNGGQVETARSNGTVTTLTIVEGIQAGTLVNQYTYFVQVGSLIQVFLKVQFALTSGGVATFTSSMPSEVAPTSNFSNIAQINGSGSYLDTGNNAVIPCACTAINGTKNMQCQFAVNGSSTDTVQANVWFIYDLDTVDA